MIGVRQTRNTAGSKRGSRLKSSYEDESRDETSRPKNKISDESEIKKCWYEQKK